MDIEQLYQYSARIVENVDTTFKRYLYDQIDWNNRLIVIKGAKGVGKTTLIKQHIKEHLARGNQALYVTLDHIWFSKHSLLDLAEYFYTHGGKYLFLDEVHKYEGWIQEVKNIYDLYPTLYLVVTGSSLLNLADTTIADLSRRCRQYILLGLSFREYLALEGITNIPLLNLEDILTGHIQIASQITKEVKVLPFFERYIKNGYYPFYREDTLGFTERLSRVITAVIETEIPTVGKLEYDSVYKAKRLLMSLAQQSPYTLNITDLCRKLEISRAVLLKLLDLMHKGGLIRRFFEKEGDIKALAKPEKILFDNTNLMFALADNFDSGTMRETFFASQMSRLGTITMPAKGDLSLPDGTTFEVGGPNKKHSQVKDVPISYVVRDNIEIGFANKIPLWLFGILY